MVWSEPCYLLPWCATCYTFQKLEYSFLVFSIHWLILGNLCSSVQWRKWEWKYFPPYNFLTVNFLMSWPICFLHKIPCKNVLPYRAKTLSAVLLLSFKYSNSWIAHNVSKIMYIWPGTLSFIALVTSSKASCVSALRFTSLPS